MITKLIIKDNTKSPVRYLNTIPAFKNGREFNFKDGVNIIVGENGSGKTTLLNLIKAYLMVDDNECHRGEFNCNINKLFGVGDKLLDGVDVYADYTKNTFRMQHISEHKTNKIPKTFEGFGTLYSQMNSSTGEGVLISLQSLFNMMFSKDAKLTFDYKDQFQELYQDYVKYVDEHRQTNIPDEYTILMDEPDRNLDIANAADILNILSKRKEQTQIITTVHNPLIIYSIVKKSDANFIEMSNNYIEKVMNTVDRLVNTSK